MRAPSIFAMPATAIAIAAAIFACGGCSEKAAVEPKSEAVSPSQIPPKLWEEFSGENALAEVRKQVDIGPRPSGTAALAHARKLIVDSLGNSGWEVERQEFEHAPVPKQGALRFANVIARFPEDKSKPAPRDAQRVIIGSHYDSKRMDGVRFVGANDGGSSTGALLELARVLAKAPALASRIELVFFDGEEAVVKFDPTETGPDGLVGSRHYAQTLRKDGRAGQFRFALVWDMIGDADLTVTLPRNTPAHLSGALFNAADALGVRRHFGFFGGDIQDDHSPLHDIAKIPAMDVIDFDFPPWHTSSDTMDKLSAKSLETVGRVTIWMLVSELGK